MAGSEQVYYDAAVTLLFFLLIGRWVDETLHVLGALTLMGWLLTGAGWQIALTYAIAVVIITCPCALALAVPAVQVAAASRLFREGVIVKAPDGLERVAEIDMVVFDKTGTLTLGRPQLLNANGVPESALSLIHI